MASGWTPADELRPAVAGVDGPPPGYLRTADLMAALSLASDLAVGLPAEHAVRSCYIAMHVADQMHLPAEQRVDVYYALSAAVCSRNSLAFSALPAFAGVVVTGPIVEAIRVARQRSAVRNATMIVPGQS